MSLSSLLLPKKKIDKELDAFFTTKPAATPPAKKKRRLDSADVPEAEHKKPKRVETSTIATPKATKHPKKLKLAESVEDEDLDDDNNSDRKQHQPTVESESDEDMSDAQREVDSDDDPDAPPPVHESLTKRVRTKPKQKGKIVPEGETPTQRDARTLFVGGLPVEIVQKKAIQKQLSRHLLSFLPAGSKVKIESTRFRSVAFRDPTSSTALSSPAPSSSDPSANPGTSTNHASARASSWRLQPGGAPTPKDKDKDAAEAAGAEKQYLTPAQKKKILFIQGAIHPEARSVNAYVVLAHHTLPDEAGGAGDDTPYRAAPHVARAANGSRFAERTLRVDLCARVPAPGADADAEVAMGAVGDPKRSVFVGNLDFGAREEDVREFFEGVVGGERGPAPLASSSAVIERAVEGEEEKEEEGGRWVLGVRLVRDRETQLGKGFGYVRFVDRDCVDEILALGKTEEGRTKLRFAKRTLRVQRCRVVGSSAAAAAAAAKSAATPKGEPKSRSTYPKRGDPSLGARIAHLDKDARKAAKKTDAARLERRAQKKMIKMKMKTGPSAEKVRAAVAGGKSVGGRKSEKGLGKGKGKERERERKVRVGKHGKGTK